MGARDVGDAADVVEHHRAGAFEEETVVLEARVVDDILHPVPLLEQFDHVGAAFASAIRRVHRVHDDAAAAMRREPVVREHAVGPIGRVVLEEVDRDTRAVDSASASAVDLGERGAAATSPASRPSGRTWNTLSAAVWWLTPKWCGRTITTADGAWSDSGARGSERCDAP